MVLMVGQGIAWEVICFGLGAGQELRCVCMMACCGNPLIIIVSGARIPRPIGDSIPYFDSAVPLLAAPLNLLERAAHGGKGW